MKSEVEQMYERVRAVYGEDTPSIDVFCAMRDKILKADDKADDKHLTYFCEAINYVMEGGLPEFGRIHLKHALQAVNGKLYTGQIERMIEVGVAPTESQKDLDSLRFLMERCQKLSKDAKSLFSLWLEHEVICLMEIEGKLGIEAVKKALSLLDSAAGTSASDIAEAISGTMTMPFIVERRNERTDELIEAIGKPDFQAALQTVRNVAKENKIKMGESDVCFHHQDKIEKYIVGIWKEGKRIEVME